jgi:hypothetical protein
MAASERVETEEDSIVTVISASGSVLGRGLW